MTPAVTVFLDNEAVQSLMDTTHAKHRRALALVAGLLDQAGAGRHRARERAVPRVPTAVRVEAGWDRRSPSAATANTFA